MSASLCRRLTRTWPLPVPGALAPAVAALAPALGARRSTCTWRSVTGSIASAFLSTTPNGAAANLAIGGALPVCTLSGKLDALASGRPALSRSVAGISMLNAAFSASGFGNAISLTSVALSSLSNTGASGLPAAGRRRTWAASSRATGAVKRTLIGRIGRHGALARSRSQLKSAVKAARTVKGKRCSIVVTIFGLLAAAMPLPQTSRRAAPFGSGRSQRASSVRSARALSMRRAFRTCARSVAADDPEREPLADALDLAPRVGSDGVGDRRAVQAQQEVLVLFDVGAATRLHRDDGRTAGREREPRRSGQRRRAGGGRGRARGAGLRCRLPVGADRRGAAACPGPSGSRKS